MGRRTGRQASGTGVRRTAAAMLAVLLVGVAAACDDGNTTNARGQSSLNWLCGTGTTVLGNGHLSFGCDEAGRMTIGDGGKVRQHTARLEIFDATLQSCQGSGPVPCVPAADITPVATSDVPASTYRFPRGNDWPKGAASAQTFLRISARDAGRLHSDAATAGALGRLRAVVDGHDCGELDDRFSSPGGVAFACDTGS